MLKKYITLNFKRLIVMKIKKVYQFIPGFLFIIGSFLVISSLFFKNSNKYAPTTFKTSEYFKI